MSSIQRISKLFSLIIFIACYARANVSVDPNSTLFVDQYGRFRVYHGVNVVRKLAPYYPDLDKFDSNYSLVDEDLTNIKSWGFNVIRLHVAWQGVQPQRDVYNDTYIKKLRQIIRNCEKFGIKVILDAHQDLYNRQFCGNGFPDWTVKRNNFPFPLPIRLQFDQNGFPKRKDCLNVHFSIFYFSQDLNRFQQNFFKNQNGLLDQFTKFWQRIARFMKDQANLFGYQILNEPIGQDFGKNPFDIFNPKVANNKYLLPAYRKIYNAIRQIDDTHLIFYQPSVLDPFGFTFQQSIGNQSEKAKQVQSYHSYCPFVNKLGQPTLPLTCQFYDKNQIAGQEKSIKRLKIGGFLTEFGALSDSEKSARQIRSIIGQAAKYFRSWTYWQFKYLDDITTAASPGTTESFYNVDGSLQLNKIKTLARPYAYAICGEPIQQTFEKGVFLFKWNPSTQCNQQNTQLFLSLKFYFRDGFEVNFTNCQSCQLRQLNQEGYFKVIMNEEGSQTVTLTIKPK